MELILEIVTRGGKVLSLHKVQGETIKVGRAYDNHLILQEEHVCPLHATFYQNEQGELYVENCSDINGIKDKANKPLDANVKIESGDVLIIGKYHVRVVQPEHPVSAAKKLNILEDVTRAANHWYWALLMVVTFFIWNLLSSYLSAFIEFHWSKVSVMTVLVTLGIAIIPVTIGLIARVFRKDVKFYSIVVFCFGLILLFELWSSFNALLKFNWGSHALIGLVEQAVNYLVLGLFLWGSFYLATNMALKKITLVSTSLVLIIASLLYVHDKGDDKVVLYPVFAAKVLPSSFLIAKPVDVDGYVQSNQSLFEQASKEAERRNKEADEQ